MQHALPTGFSHKTRAVVVGASAGGVEALLELFSGLQPDFALPIIVVLHISQERNSLLPEVFGHRLTLPVREAADKEPIVPGTVYFAPPGYHLLVEQANCFALSCDAREHFSRPSIDVLMESAADVWGSALAGIVLTGANDDGAAGLARVGTAGGLTVVQDPVEAQARHDAERRDRAARTRFRSSIAGHQNPGRPIATRTMTTAVPAKILIVDDLPENLLALAALIRGENRIVLQANSGEQALALLLEHEFALAILDVQMPGMNGFELAELMRGTEKTRGIPIIFVSAAGKDLNYAFKGYENGAVDFLQKPLDAHAVKSKVSVFVDLYAQRSALIATREELQRAVKMRDDFMSMVSHELRTPLNTLFLQTQVRKLGLEKRCDGQPDAGAAARHDRPRPAPDQEHGAADR